MNQYKKLVNDSIIMIVGNFGSKVIGFLMLPLYTSYLSTKDYGIVDLIITTTALLLPIISCSIYDGVLRFAMDKNRDSGIVLSSSFLFMGAISLLCLALIVPLSAINHTVIYLIPLLVIQMFQSLFSQYAKSINELQIFAINGMLLSFLTALLNFIFLVPISMGYTGYLLSMIIANFCSVTYLFVSLKLWKSLSVQRFSVIELKELLKFSMPLIPNSVAWWLTTSVGKYSVLFFIGASGNGLFAVANKIPSLLSVFTSIFAQSWQISAIEDYESNSTGDFFKNVYSYYVGLLIIGGSVIILLSQPLINLLVSKEFISSWRFVGFLVASVITSSITGFLGSRYVAMKDTIGVFFTTVVGAIINVIANIILVPLLGIQGVGIGSTISFIVVWIIRHKRFFKKNSYFNFTKNFFCFALIIVQCIFSAVVTGRMIYISQILLFFAILYLERDTVYIICNSIVIKLKNRHL